MYICDNMKSFLLILCLFICTQSQAQYEIEELTLPETLNTIGINLTPAALVLFNGIPYQTRFSAVYKRQVDVSKRLRFTLNYLIDERYFQERNELPLSFSDTTITFLLESEDNFGVDLRVGLEYFKPNRNTTMVYGFDVFLGYYFENSEEETQPFYIDPSCNCTLPSPFVLAQKRETHIEYLLAGADFSIGQQLNLSDKMNFIIQWTPSVFVKLPVNEEYTDISSREEAPQNSVDFNLRGFELFLNYVF